jgi:hypothetical protein
VPNINFLYLNKARRFFWAFKIVRAILMWTITVSPMVKADNLNRFSRYRKHTVEMVKCLCAFSPHVFSRRKLPATMPGKEEFNLWSILKSCIGQFDNSICYLHYRNSIIVERAYFVILVLHVFPQAKTLARSLCL